MRQPDVGQPVTLGLRPQHVMLTEGTTHKVEMIEALGGVSYLHVSAATGEKLIVESREATRLRVGDTVGLRFDAAHVMAFDAKTELRLR